AGHMPVAYQEERAIGGAVAAHFIILSRATVVDTPKNKTIADLKDKKEFDFDNTEKNKMERYVNHIGWKLASLSARPNIQWTFGVIDADEANAFSAPGGYVLVTTGMLKKCDNEAQLAAVLAHEISHVVEQHSIKV